MDATRKLFGQRLIDHPVTVEPALSGKRRRDDAHAKMRLAARTPPGMALVPVQFIDDGDASGVKALVSFSAITSRTRMPNPSLDTDR